ncbi:MAG: hypothetical protein SNH88_03300 [Rikenellaceae bacterium]
MKGFSPFKTRANKFNYTPRYYDPEKEAREKRREEMLGHRSDSTAEEYTPGQYIRRKSAARHERLRSNSNSGRVRVWIMLAFVLIAGWLVAMIYPRLISAFGLSEAPTTQIVEAEEFNSMTPITIVPNDYKEP